MPLKHSSVLMAKCKILNEVSIHIKPTIGQITKHFSLAPMNLKRESDGLGCLDSIPSPLLSEISLLDACNRLCSRIITQFGSRELSSSKGRNDVPFGYRTQQPNLLGEYLQQGVESFWLNAQTAMPPVHISAIGPNVVPHDDRFGGATVPASLPVQRRGGRWCVRIRFRPASSHVKFGRYCPRMERPCPGTSR